MATQDDELGRFLLDLLPTEAQERLRRLTELRYPIPDRRSLAEQLGGDAESDRQATADLLSAFRPEDFGLDTLQSALEKCRQRAPWLLGAALPLDDPGRRTLEHAVATGGLSFTESSVIARGRGGAGVTADCNCDATGGCTIIITDGVLYCGTGTCTGGCGLVVTIPTKFFARF
jgi:hypothetical protein